MSRGTHAVVRSPAERTGSLSFVTGPLAMITGPLAMITGPLAVVTGPISLRTGPDGTPSLRQRFDPRRNNLTLLRLALALPVLVVHAEGIRLGERLGGLHSAVGGLAVEAFFVLSGFLVAGSARRLGSVRRFLWHRALRIVPGFWVNLFVIAGVIAPLLAVGAGRSPFAVLTGPDSSAGFVSRNAFLLIRQWEIGALSPVLTGETTLNGSLWSLYYEAACYVVLALLMLAGVMRPRGAHCGGHRRGLALMLDHRREVLAAVTVVIWLTLLLDVVGPVLPLDKGRTLLFMFLVGVLAELYADHVPMDGRIALGALAVVVLGTGTGLMHDYELIGAPALAYALLWVSAAAPVPVHPTADLSYGVYVYHWPLQLVLVALGLGGLGELRFALVSVAVTLLVAAASWFWVERPALSCRNARWVSAARATM